MKIAGFAAFAAVSVLTLFAYSAPALAQADCKAVVAPSPFGPDDQTGATNRITPFGHSRRPRLKSRPAT